jgi:type IV fimbrial biogenesis protein FimT
MMKKNKISDSSGFSFVELMVVIALVGILAAIGVPNFLRGLPEKKLKGAARNLYADMQRARLLAVKENRSVRVRFDTATSPGVYYFDDDEVGDPGYDQWDTGEFGRKLTDYASGIAYGSGSAGDGAGGGACNWSTPASACSQIAFITFSSTGTANSGSIYLQNQNQDVSYAVTVTDFGAVKIRRFSGSGWE